MDQFIATLILGVFITSLDEGLCLQPPTFKVTPNWPVQNYYDQDGPSIQLDCLITNNVNYTMIWTKNDKPITLNDEQLLLINKNQSLVFEIPKQTQSGLYKCLAYNDAGHINHTGNILITARKQETRPSVVDTEPSTTVSRAQVGDKVIISCTFDVGGSTEALMDLTLSWYKDNVSLTDTNHTTYGLNNTETNNQISSLTIDHLRTADYGVYKCFGQNAKGNDSKLISVSPPEIRKNKLPVTIIIIGSSAGFFVTMVIIVVAVILRHRRTKSNKYEELEWAEPNNFDVPEHKIEYDVFISYSSDDLDWVKDVLFEKLSDHGYQVCIDFKDFTPGMAVAENIIDAIYKSHKTIVLMSNNFLKSMWGQFELQQAHNRAIMKRSDVLILIKYDECKVPSKLMGKTFLDWSDVKVQPHFWTRLFEAIGPPGKFEIQTDDKKDEKMTTEGTKEAVDVTNELKENNNESKEINGFHDGNKEIDQTEMYDALKHNVIDEYKYNEDGRIDVNDKVFLINNTLGSEPDGTEVDYHFGVNYHEKNERNKTLQSEGIERIGNYPENFPSDSVDMVDVHKQT